MRRQWILACAVAEAVGMTASAAAARTAQATSSGAGLALVVAGGLVEGTALGFLQATVLRELLGRRDQWTMVTVLVAGIGWAAGAAPSVLNQDEGGVAPPLGMVLFAAAGLGLAMGSVLGAAQAALLRHRTRHPGRWVVANACGWAAAMPVVFAAATTAGASWGTPLLLGFAAVTGAVAGAVLGVITGVWLPHLGSPALPRQGGPPSIDSPDDRGTPTGSR